MFKKGAKSIRSSVARLAKKPSKKDEDDKQFKVKEFTFETKDSEMSYSEKRKSVDPRQVRLIEYSKDPTASARDVLMARVQSRRFDMGFDGDDFDEEYIVD